MRGVTTADDLTVDHIKSRYDGGTDDLDNLQILCRSCNSTKGIRPDIYWSRLFYWDTLPSEEGLANLRAAQSDLFAAITGDPHGYFCRSLSEIARLLYVCAWVVGAGKTIGIAVVAWALNFLILRERGKVMRADRILVLCKEEAIRDQLAEDLTNDLVKYKIVRRAPKVGVVTRGEQFQQHEWLDQYDIVCACIQQLWQKDETMCADAARILARFPLIAFDEPHFANERVNALVETAATSVCVGFTGTPIDSNGSLLKRMVGLSIYGYQDADEFDQSVKYLSADPTFFTMFVRELDIHDADIMRCGLPAIATDTNEPGYDQNIRPAEAVCGAVIEELKVSDQLILEGEQPAAHRGPGVVMDRLYWRHARITFDSIAMAEHAATTMNQMFAADRRTFPREEGWCAEVVHSGWDTTDPGDTTRTKIPAKPLARSSGEDPHPWMRAYRTGQMDARCARILCCINIGREGINNPFCGLNGIACKMRSLIAQSQGPIGRGIRSVIEWLLNVLHVPPSPLDTVRIITHKTYENTVAIQDAIHFVCNMREHFERLPGIEDLLNIETKPFRPLEPENPPLTRPEKIQILGKAQELKVQGVEPSQIVAIICGPEQPGSPRSKSVEGWARVCLGGSPSELREKLRLDDGITPIVTVWSERLRYEPNDVELERFIKIHHPDLMDSLPFSERERRLAVKLYKSHAERFQQPRLAATTHINTLAGHIGGIVLRDLGKYFQGERGRPFELARKAIKLKLGVPAGVKLKDGSNWDTPETHALIRRPDIQNELVAWIIARLIDEGACPQFEAALASVAYEAGA
jgi:hypothetical protein